VVVSKASGLFGVWLHGGLTVTERELSVLVKGEAVEGVVVLEKKVARASSASVFGLTDAASSAACLLHSSHSCGRVS
jgi:hypothetical protein